MTSYIMPLLSVVVGALLGYLSSFLGLAIRQKQDVTLRLLDQYFEIRKDLVNEVSQLSDLDLSMPLHLDDRRRHRDAISLLFYKHYDFLPQPVLEALILLNVCLEWADGKLYGLCAGAVVPLEDRQVPKFIEQAALFENSKYMAAIALQSSNATARTNQAIVLHARHVLFTLNKYASIRDLLRVTRSLKKSSYAGYLSGAPTSVSGPQS